MSRHVQMMFRAGLIDGIDAKVNPSQPVVFVKDLSWDGHEFIGAIGHEEIWDKMKKDVGPTGLASFSLKALKDVSIEAATKWLEMKMGL